MNNSYRKLLLTSSLILMSLNTNALSHKDLTDETFEMSHSRFLSKEVGTEIAPASDEDKVNETDTGPASYQEQTLKEEESDFKDSQIISISRNFSEIASSDEMAIPQENLFIPAKFGKVQVTYKNNEFYLAKNDSQKIQIQRWNLSKELRGIKEEQLNNFLKVGYVSIKQQDDTNFSLNANFRLRGGGDIADRMEMGSTGTRVAEGVAGAAGATGGAWLGGVIGGAIGSVFGPGGTATGAWIGQAIGGAIGAGVGTALGKTN